jgi:NADH-quinone oxidoreductase subunit C
METDPKPTPPPTPPPAKPPAPPKAPAVMVTTPWSDALTQRLTEQFQTQVREFSIYLGQKFLVAESSAVVPILEFLRLEEDFDYLVDVTAVDYPARPARFEVIYILYSFAKNERIRIKTNVAEGESPRTATGVHLTADWLEREVYDMFGIRFEGHPNMVRILMPDDWQGHPLRKDYGIIQMDNRWVQENLGIESGQ